MLLFSKSKYLYEFQMIHVHSIVENKFLKVQRLNVTAYKDGKEIKLLFDIHVFKMTFAEINV